MSSATPFRNLGRASLILAALLSATPALAQRGAMTVPSNLEQLTDRASDIVRGTVVSARVEKHPELGNLDTLVVTLRVSDAIKGTASGTLTFRQYLWDIRDRKDAAGYVKGREYVLLLNAPSRFGLTSPAGLEQGRFRVLRDAQGRKIAVNGRGNVALLRGVGRGPAQQGMPLSLASTRLVEKHQGGPIAVDELVQLLRELAGNPG